MEISKPYCEKCHSKLLFLGSYSYGFKRILSWQCETCGEEYEIILEKEHTNGCSICACSML
ncbi:MAG: hypothetical protein DRN88_04570 [Candidatus Hydrothermarchaeota archaeon]|nr:MAG: hypothetical protein DRN88_04570 [Candidatus Hydrothermarchaeota archaeon]